MSLNLSPYLDELSKSCAAYDVKRLELFGSASRQDFDLNDSDLNFLVDFAETHSLGAFDRYFGLKKALEQLVRLTW
jgi:predicted nucleotidyltransferase